MSLEAAQAAAAAPADGAALANGEHPWVVQKYGGTSVGKFLPAIVESITPSYLATNRVAIVCSARSGNTKALGTTSLLLQAASQAMMHEDSPTQSNSGTPLSNSVVGTTPPASSSLAGSLSARLAGLNTENGAPSYYQTVDRILNEHLAAAREAVRHNDELLAQLEASIVDDCDGLREFLNAARIIHEVSPRSRDIVMGIGEKLACRLVVAALQDAGVSAELVTLENVVEEVLGDAAPAPPVGPLEDATYLDQTFYDNLAQVLGRRVSACSGVPVITGYFGNVPGSLLTQVGRGYTDLCAALCAVGLRASELQIWKEVDGVFTADPRKVPTARLVPSITPEEAAELTYYGSEVIHPFTMEQAIKKLVPIRIKNVQNPSGCGTVIFPDHHTGSAGTEDVARDPFVDGHVEQPATPAPGTPSLSGGNGASLCNSVVSSVQRKLPTAVTIKDNVLVLNVHSNRKTISHSFFARIFGTLNRFCIVVDLISTSEVHVSMAMAAAVRPRTLELLCAELEHVGTVSVLRNMAILSLVGKQMRHMVGVAGRMFSTLAEGNVNIEMISQGANEINISCVIHESVAKKALNLIHYSILELSPKPTNMQGGSFGRSFF